MTQSRRDIASGFFWPWQFDIKKTVQYNQTEYTVHFLFAYDSCIVSIDNNMVLMQKRGQWVQSFKSPD